MFMYSVVIRMQVRANHAICTCMRVWDGCKSAAFVLRFATRLGLRARCMNFSTRLALHAVIMLYYIHTRSGKWKADLAGGIARSVKDYYEVLSC